ncbi:MAG: SGNH/GDSL hydrolase family protein [Phycisphaerae bacterium]|jgi:lysophospholipase L1-like esterase|nr:SGNH/GDSL hydrolase family protein [Phycisphaerae bacterium]
MSTLIDPGSLVLFQGDSITDAGRNYFNPQSMGWGYAQIAASALDDSGIRFLNRGISGDRAVDLQLRWDRDCLALKPDWVSIMIGVNDAWRRYDCNDPTSRDAFTDSYRDILTQTRDILGARLIILEPFVLPVSPYIESFREDLAPKIEATRALADEFGAIYVPLDSLFAEACTSSAPEYWSEDGVHPTLAGHELIANTWLDAVGVKSN